MPEGIIIKGYSGFYYVQSGAKLWECSLRGRFRLHAQDFLPGDRVNVALHKGNKGVIEEVLPRTNQLLRPAIANVNQVVVVFALKSPEPDLNLLDRILIQAEAAGIEPVICFNKADLLPVQDDLVLQYLNIGYKCLAAAAKQNIGVAELRELLRDKTSVFAGPSGVGKSTLLNALQPGLELRTGEISAKLKRGRHTTRHVELIPLQEGGFVADTPGFSSLDLPQMKREELPGYFPEISELDHLCRFSSCLHGQEPDCAVKDAVERGIISRNRYENYLFFLKEVIASERRY